jgi:predicted amidohydrolase YtcJ
MRFRLLALALTASGLVAQERQKPKADLILYGGVVYRGGETPAQAVAVRGNLILAVGGTESMLELRGPKTRVIPLRGRLVVPGFNDNHVHFASAARFLEFNIMTTTTQAEFVERVKDVVSRVPKGEWITGGFWGAYENWAQGSATATKRKSFTPNMSLVEEITKNHPMLIQRFDRGKWAANRIALKSIGITEPMTAKVSGVKFAADASGKATGVFRGAGARRLFGARLIRKASRARRVQQTKFALRRVAEAGVTSLSDMSDDAQLEIYRELHAKGELSVRVHFRPMLERWPDQRAKGIRVGSGDAWIRMGALKGHIDGIMGTSSARFLEPYSNDPQNRGRWRKLMVDEQGKFVDGQFLGYMLGADKAGLQLSVHAIGDEANHLLLDYLEVLHRKNGARDRRFRLVHAQVVDRKDMPRLGALGVIAEVQPFHLSDDMRWMEQRIGHERCKNAYAFKSLVESGAVLCFGTDWPGTSASSYPINPMLGIYAAVTRQTITGKPAGGWFPDERISVTDALKAYTWGSAYASFEENIKGTLVVGKLADLTVLSKNILECEPGDILKTVADLTIVDGRVVFER